MNPLSLPSAKWDEIGATACCVILVVAIAIQNVVLVEFGDNGAGIKPYHVVVFVALITVLIVRRMEWVFPPIPFMISMLVLLAIAVIDGVSHGFTVSFANYIVAFLIVFVFMNIGSSFHDEQWARVARIGSAIIMVLVLLNLARQYEAVLAFVVNPTYHPQITPVFGGGVNLEATWLALFGLFYRRDIKGAIYLALCMLVVGFYVSRVGIVLTLIVALYIYYRYPKGKLTLFKAVLPVLLLIIVGIVLAWSSSMVLSRFSTIGGDNGTLGRMEMWKYIGSAFEKAPFLGYGAGNAINAVIAAAGSGFLEDNVHNYYAQVLLDFGLIGIAAFVFLLVRFAINLKQDGLTPVNMAIVLYLIAAFIQFRGGESMLGFFLAAYFSLATAYRYRKSIGQHDDVRRRNRKEKD